MVFLGVVWTMWRSVDHLSQCLRWSRRGAVVQLGSLQGSGPGSAA